MTPCLRLLLAGALASICACDGSQSTAQLEHYLQATPVQKSAVIAAVPSLAQPRFFAYEATSLRSPFQRNHADEGNAWQASVAHNAPDEGRVRSFLERLELAQFEMVGTLSNHLESNALLRANGVVHRLKTGDYLGRNNGQIAAISPQHVEVFEVISDGRGGWLERSLTISLKQQS